MKRKMLHRLRVITQIRDLGYVICAYQFDFNLAVVPQFIDRLWPKQTYSLATAAQLPSGESARPRIGNVDRVINFSKRNVSNE